MPRAILLRYALAGALLACTLSLGLTLTGCRGNQAGEYLAAGDAALRATKFSEAEQNYVQAVKIAPNDPRTHVALGNLYVLEHKTGAAQLEFMKVLELEPTNAAAHVALGDLYADQGQYGLAEAQERAAVALQPTRPEYRNGLGAVLVKEGKTAEAEAELRTAVGLNPKYAQAHFALANLLANDPNRRAQADAEYAQARALDPKLVPPAAAAAAPTPAEAAAAAPAPAGRSAIKPLNKIFVLTHSSPVYENPDSSSAVVGQVKRKKYVHVIGITGNWLQVRLRNGTVGFVPTSAAE